MKCEVGCIISVKYQFAGGLFSNADNIVLLGFIYFRIALWMDSSTGMSYLQKQI